VGGGGGCAPDLPGYGRTRVPADADHSLSGAAELTAAWLRQRGLGPVWLVGHDIGGGVAQILAVHHPDLVARLSLTNSIVDDAWPVTVVRLTRLVARAGLYPAACRAGLVPNPYVRRELRRGFAEPAALAKVDAARVVWDAKVTDPQGRRAFARHLAALDDADTRAVTPALRRLPLPAQLIWGTSDPFLPWPTVGRRLERILPSPTVVLLERCGHFTPLECPGRLVDALLDRTA
jgi:pimeloyl-ACP methyl ester carboxylesterase